MNCVLVIEARKIPYLLVVELLLVSFLLLLRYDYDSYHEISRSTTKETEECYSLPLVL